MVSPMSYLFAKSAAELPILFVMALFAIGIPAYGLSNFHSAGFMRFWLAWTVNFWAWESHAQLLSVCFANPILGVCAFIGQWFSGFLYGGFLIPAADMIWPLKLFFYILPLKYGCRAMVNTEFSASTFEGYVGCLAAKVNDTDRLCYGTDGETVVNEMARVYPLYGYEQGDAMYEAFGFKPGPNSTRAEYDPYWADVLVMVIFAVLCKVGWAYLLCSKSGKSSKVLTK